MKVFWISFVLFLVLLTRFLSVPVNCARLRGVTLQSHPFIIKDGNQYKGYIIDVLNAMKNISDFDYYLYTAEELGTVDKRENIHKGLLGDVYANAADFGVSNIQVTEERKSFVDFTDPVLNYSTSALVLKAIAGNIKTFGELADQTTISYGSLRDSQTMKLFAESDDMVLQRMYALMRRSDQTVDSLGEALEKVRTSKYAFIGDSTLIAELAKHDCSLKVIKDNRQYFRRQIAIAMPQGSKYLDVFNQFLKQLIASGKLDTIRDHYWKVDCSHSSDNSVIFRNSFIKMIIVLNVLFFCSEIMF